jgi:hypothetical protein
MESPRARLLFGVVPVLEAMVGLRHFDGTYPQPPRVVISDTATFATQNYHPFIAVFPISGSRLGLQDFDGGELDRCAFGIYGQVARTADVPAWLWADRLRHDCAKTLREAISPTGTLRHLAQWLNLSGDPDGRAEEFGFADTHADFLLPCTAQLTYTLADLHAA